MRRIPCALQGLPLRSMDMAFFATFSASDETGAATYLIYYKAHLLDQSLRPRLPEIGVAIVNRSNLSTGETTDALLEMLPLIASDH